VIFIKSDVKILKHSLYINILRFTKTGNIQASLYNFSSGCTEIKYFCVLNKPPGIFKLFRAALSVLYE